MGCRRGSKFSSKDVFHFLKNSTLGKIIQAVFLSANIPVKISQILDHLWIAWWLHFFTDCFDFGHLQWEIGCRKVSKFSSKDLSHFLKNSNLGKIIQAVFLSANILVKISPILDHLWGTKGLHNDFFWQYANFRQSLKGELQMVY